MTNQKVSLEEVRAKRLAREQQAQIENNAGIVAQTPPDEQLSGMTPNDDMTASGPADPTAALVSGLSAPSPIILPDLDAMLTSATPEQLQRIKTLAAAKGLMPTDVAASRKMPDGSMTVAVQLDAPTVEQLEIWAEADGCSLVEEAQKRISEALTNYLYGDWNPVIEQPPAAAVVPAAAATTK